MIIYFHLVKLSLGGARMDKKKDKIKEDVNVELGGMGLYGTTSNKEIAGYKTSGDIENAGNIEKGFIGPEGEAGAQASLKSEKD